jgi:hypothetical protein
MNQIFSFKRYAWLVKRQCFENAAIYKWGIALMVLVTGLLFWLTSNWKTVDKFMEINPHLINDDITYFYPRLGQGPTFLLTGIFLFCIFGGWFFESLTSKQKRMFYFSLPVLPLERITVAFTFVMILMPVLFFTIFTVFDFIFVQFFNHVHGTSVQMFFKTASYYEGTRKIILLSIPLSITSIFTLASLIVGKKGPVISIIAIIALLYIWVRSSMLFDVHPDDLLNSGIFTLIIPVCWMLMYFVMKKKEA